MKIFVTGASGYIGGSVASLLVKKGHQVRGLVRNAAKAEGVRAQGIEPVMGSLDDAALLEAEAKAADAVINAADSDHLGAVQALLAGLAGSGKRLLHTSGSSIVGDEAMGEPSERTFTEETPVKPEPDKEHRVALNKRLLEAAPGVHTVILCNTLIYGNTLGPPAQSVQIPRSCTRRRRRGSPATSGAG
ncbi:NAD(P)H-binding protein [Cystobacter fuscus]